MSGSRHRTLIGILASCVGLIALLALPSGAAAKDRNHDRIPDRWEKNHHLSLGANQARRDQDRDGLRNRGEFMASDKPHDADSDNDGVEDGDENAGTIKSFDSDTGRLVINLFNGDTLSGQVTSGTEIECENENENENEAGDDHGGRQENESGDDRHARGGENSGPSEDSGPGNAADDESSGNHESDENDEQGESSCSTSDLTVGAAVHEAELEASSTGAVFDEIELAE